tara:strand:+ start:3093 stop:3230 length:138 start_codon:yes stop_codon:yes gene_type:complete
MIKLLTILDKDGKNEPFLMGLTRFRYSIESGEYIKTAKTRCNIIK